MNPSTIPPVRRVVPTRRLSLARAQEVLQGWVGPRAIRFFGSGTQALAAAILDANRRRGVEAPEVIIPAYGCPDLVAACVFAGVRAVPVDTYANAWGYDLSKLAAAMSDRTVAILAVNLCGIGDQASAVGEIARDRGIFLIQDSAQFLSVEARPDWVGDYVVLSFGRGKPLNLLGGGALLLPAERFEATRTIASSMDGRARLRRTLMSSAAAALAFNTVTMRPFYGWTASLPGLGVGQTRYSPLEKVIEDTDVLPRRFAAALPGFQGHCGYEANRWWPVLDGWSNLGITAVRVAGSDQSPVGPLLRLPLLAADADQRDRIVRVLGEAGLGASAFYAQPINRIAGIPSQVASLSRFVNAEQLAGRLFTLPTHEALGRAEVGRADRLLRTVLNS